MPPKIIGIAGTNGSGKDTVGHLLATKHNFLFISVTDILRDELKRQGKDLGRHNMRNLSSEWRKKYGLGVLIDRAKDVYDSSGSKYDGLAMASLRNPGEVDSVHEYGGVVIWLDSDPMVRYKRITEIHRGEHRSVDDKKTYEEFLADEEAEMHHPEGGDNTTLSMSKVKEKSDLFLTNDSNNLEELGMKLDQLLGF